jgi:maltodextrin utilization protein YvdJ
MMVSSTHKIEERKIVDMISRAFSMLWITLNQAFIMNNYISVLTCIVCVFPLLVTPYANIVPARVKKKSIIICFAQQINYIPREIQNPSLHLIGIL